MCTRLRWWVPGCSPGSPLHLVIIYHISLGFMCSVGFLSLQNFFKLFLLVFPRLAIFSIIQLTAFLPWSVECTPGHLLPSPQPKILTRDSLPSQSSDGGF